MSSYCALAIEAATERLSLAASGGGRVVTRHLHPARIHSAHVFEYARELLNEVAADFSALDFVAFGCGPGSFTGVRIAATAAQAIGFAGTIPVCRVSSLAVLAARAARELGAGLFAVCLDARMGSAYFALYRASQGIDLHAEIADCLIDPASFTLGSAETVIAVGSGWRACPSLLERNRPCLAQVHPGIEPAAGDLLMLAGREFALGRTVAPADALPEYLSPGPAAAPAMTLGMVSGDHQR